MGLIAGVAVGGVAACPTVGWALLADVRVNVVAGQAGVTQLAIHLVADLAPWPACHRIVSKRVPVHLVDHGVGWRQLINHAPVSDVV